VRRTF